MRPHVQYGTLQFDNAVAPGSVIAFGPSVWSEAKLIDELRELRLRDAACPNEGAERSSLVAS